MSDGSLFKLRTIFRLSFIRAIFLNCCRSGSQANPIAADQAHKQTNKVIKSHRSALASDVGSVGMELSLFRAYSSCWGARQHDDGLSNVEDKKHCYDE